MTTRSKTFIYQWRDALVLAVPNLTGSACKVALVLGSYFDARGEGAWPSQSRLQRETDLSRRTVQRALDELEGRALIEREQRSRMSSTRYRALIPTARQVELLEGASPVTPPCVTSAQGGVTSGASGGVTSGARSPTNSTPPMDHGTQSTGGDVVVVDFERRAQAAMERRLPDEGDSPRFERLLETVHASFVSNGYMAGGHTARRVVEAGLEALDGLEDAQAMAVMTDVLTDLLHGRPGLRPTNLISWTGERVERAVSELQGNGDDVVPDEWPDGSPITEDDRRAAMRVAKAYFEVRRTMPSRREAFLFVFRWRGATALEELVRDALPELLKRCPRAGDEALFRMLHEEATSRAQQ